MVGGNAFAKTICSICYEDLKPIVEDLQSISICGHVFHELCIQQWFEYCSNGKKKNCPVCKQGCSEANAGRLYFQSVGDPNDPSLSQKPRDSEENPEELRREVTKLEGKVSGLSSALESQQKHLKELNEELTICKEQIKKEVSLKDEVSKQKATIQQLLRLESKELDRSTLECMRLKERNMALAKELAALKLVSDLNLAEEEVLKLASLGNEVNNKEIVDVLKKSLVIRNKSYKELMAKCNSLGRGEARSLGKLDKAKDKIKKLKTRVQELEIAIEVKDNEVLRGLKDPKKTTGKMNIQNDIDWNSSSSCAVKCSLEDQMKEPALPKIILDRVESVPNNLCTSRKTENFKTLKVKGVNKKKDGFTTSVLDQEIHSYTLIDEDASETFTSRDEFLYPNVKPQTNDGVHVQKCHLSKPGVASDTRNEGEVHVQCNKDGISGSRSVSKGYMANTPPAAMDDDVVLLDDDITQVQPLFHITREGPSVPVSQTGDHCFSGGLLGPDGTNWHLGKWCKRVKSNGSTVPSPAIHKSSASADDLIAVGADGRGGRIKVLRSLNQPSLERKETSTRAKRGKYETKTSSLQSQGCLQMEHFFGRAGQ